MILSYEMGYGPINSRPPAPPACPLLTMYELVHVEAEVHNIKKAHQRQQTYPTHAHRAQILLVLALHAFHDSPDYFSQPRCLIVATPPRSCQPRKCTHHAISSALHVAPNRPGISCGARDGGLLPDRLLVKGIRRARPVETTTAGRGRGTASGSSGRGN